MDVTYFASRAEFRAWLLENHDKSTEIRAVLAKKGSKTPGLTYKEAVDEALCFGWIDGIGRRIDDERYNVRFTPRKPKSIWSAVNLKRYAELKELGLVHPAGEKTFEGRDLGQVQKYSHEQKPEDLKLTAEQEAQFRANPVAWENFQKMAPSYQRAAIWLLISAKQDATRAKRLAELIAASERNEPINQLRRRTGKN